MNSMEARTPQRRLMASEINYALRTDPRGLMEREDARYHEAVEQGARLLCEDAAPGGGRCVALLAGPSSAGKTTSALLLREALARKGRECHVISLDDFFQGAGKAPRLADGSYDYEDPRAMDLPLLHTCMEEIVRAGCTRLPQYDFVAGRPAAERRSFTASADAVVIFEGINALHPEVAGRLEGQVRRLFVNTLSRFYTEEGVLLARRDIRLTRRLLRDELFRGSSQENTLHMWQQVMRGEELHLFPYAETVDVLIDTTHAYEAGVFAGALLPRLTEVAADSPYRDTLRRLREGLARFEPADGALVDEKALLREFIGQR